MKIENLKMMIPFYGLFPIDQIVVSAIAKDIKKIGYDLSHPVVIWKGENIVIDGNTRVEAAKQAGLETIPVDEKEFKDQDEALEYAIHHQRDRRNLTDADLVLCIRAVDKRRERGGDRKSEKAKSKGASEPIDSSAKLTAEIVGTSETKIKKARAVMEHGDEETKKAVESGEKSIHQAYKETQKKRKAVAPKNKPTKTYELSDAKRFAIMAISQLETFAIDDPEREKAFDYVEQWIVDHSAHRELPAGFGIRALIKCLDNLHRFIVGYGTQTDDPKYGAYFREIHEVLSQIIDIINSRRERCRFLPKYEDLPEWIQRRINERIAGPSYGCLPKYEDLPEKVKQAIIAKINGSHK